MPHHVFCLVTKFICFGMETFNMCLLLYKFYLFDALFVLQQNHYLCPVVTMANGYANHNSLLFFWCLFLRVCIHFFSAMISLQFALCMLYVAMVMPIIKACCLYAVYARFCVCMFFVCTSIINNACNINNACFCLHQYHYNSCLAVTMVMPIITACCLRWQLGSDTEVANYLLCHQINLSENL